LRERSHAASNPERDESDEELMRAYVAGNEQALERIFDRYAPLLLSVLGRRMDAPEDARDLVQQAFLQLHRARADFDANQRLRPWLFSIAFNVQREYFRRRRRLSQVELEDQHAPCHPQHDGQVEAAYDLERALPQLSREQREVVELHWLADLSFPEIAEVVGASVGNTRIRAHRAYARLRQLLGDAAPAGDLRNDSGTRAV
jgi:RNA polymerase sigma-70 factor (ECF subfamily)